MILWWAGHIAALVSVLGCIYLIGAILLIGRFVHRPSPAPRAPGPSVTILKPLHGAEHGLLENLTSFCTQNYAGPVQIVFGVQDPADPAIAVVEQLRANHSAARLDLVVDLAEHGLNRKVSNLVNMSKHIEHEIVIVADSDMQADPDYLARVVAALGQPGIGAVTCLYHGSATPALWARLAALGINAHFLPGVVVGLGLGLAHPCFGSTIALTRETIDDIGGFIGVADCLADDYAIGAALRARGLKILVSPITIGHLCAEMSARDLWHHEVRWARTIRSIDPVGYLGSIVTHAFPWALIATAIGLASLGPVIGAGLVVASLLFRLGLLRRVERAFGLPPQAYWLVPLRDLLSFAVFGSSLFGESARWKDRLYRFIPGGTLITAGGSHKP